MTVAADGPAYPTVPVRRSAREQAALYIQRLIFDGQLTRGERVPQDLIAESLGVSRIPVREALIGLEREGWVTIQLNRGAFINAFDEAAVLDRYQLNGMLYGFAVTRAMERSADGFAEHLLDIAKQLRRVRTAEQLAPLSVQFHRRVIEAARSQPAQTVAGALVRLVPGDFFALVPGAMALERRRVPSIARLVAAGEAAEASSEYREHASALGLLVLDVFNQRGLIAPSTPAPTAASAAPR